MMSFPEAHVTCPSCKAVVPWSRACINCGQKLPQRRLQDPFDALRETVSEERNRESAAEELAGAMPEPSPDEEPEGRLAKYLLRRVKVLEMADKGEIGHEVFSELYLEYIGKTRELMEEYEAIGSKVHEAHEALMEARSRVEESKERRERGEITIDEHVEDFNRLRGVIEKVSGSVTGLREQRDALGVGGETEEDAAKLKAIQRALHHYRSYLPVMVASDSIPKPMQVVVHEDLSQMLDVLESNVDWVYEHEEPAEEPEPAPEEESAQEDDVFKEVTKHVKGHDDDVRRLLRALRLNDNVLLLGPDGEGKTETMLRLQSVLGGVYLHCSDEVTERELVAGFNPSAFVGKDPVHDGLLMQIVNGEGGDAPIAYIDDATKLRPRTQTILLEAMNNKTFTNPVDGRRYSLPEGFCVVAAGNLDDVAQDAPDPGFLSRFGKTIIWGKTPIESVKGMVARYALPAHVFEFIMWVKQEVDKMRYMVPVNVMNLVKFAKEYHAYRDVYQSPGEVKQLAVDRLLRMRVLNPLGVEEYTEARRRVMEYAWEQP